MTNIYNKISLAKLLIVGSFLVFVLSGCTKYFGKTDTNSTASGTGSSGGTGATPLPGGGSGSGGTGSGGTGSGGTGSGGTGSGGTGSGGIGTGGGSTGGGSGTINPNIPQAYIQALFFTNVNQQYVRVNDSVSLNFDGSYKQVYAGNATLKFYQGPGSASDRLYTTANYFLRPYAFYSYVLFPTSTAGVNENLIMNDITAPAIGKTNIRFISLDPLTVTTPVTFVLKNALTEQRSANRTYLDHRADTSRMNFTTYDAAVYTVNFLYRDSSLLNFTRTFESGKSYTVFAGALGYNTTPRGTFPINYYQVAQHN